MDRVEVRIHSKSHIEAIFRVGLDEKKKQGYDVRYYIFSPSSLRMIGNEKDPNTILKRFSLYGRFSSPRISFDDLVDETKDSPLSFIREAYQKLVLRQWTPALEKRVITELRMLVNIFRWNLRQYAYTARDKQRVSIIEGGYKKATAFVDDYIQKSDIAFTAFRKISARYLRFGVSKMLETAIIWTEEAISLEYETATLMIYSQLKEGLSSEYNSQLVKIIQSESEYRKSELFLSHKTNEDELYQKRRLKKWFQSVLYLRSVESKLPKRLSQVFASTAAAVAMTFALFAAFFAEQKFLKSSMQWALITVIAYVFKDRIKEWLRKFLEGLMPRMMSNNISFFYSPNTGKKVCTNRLSANEKKAFALPEEILNKRKEGSSPFYDMLPEEDVTVIEHYLTTPRKKRKSKESSYSNYLTMISRFRMDEYCPEMDNVEEMSFRLEDSNLDVDSVKMERLYHIHLIVEARANKNDYKLSHYLITMTKAGIADIQKIS